MSRTQEFGAGQQPEREWAKVRANTVYANGRKQVIAVPRPDGSHTIGHVVEHAKKDMNTRGFLLESPEGRQIVDVPKRAWIFLHLPTERQHGTARP